MSRIPMVVRALLRMHPRAYREALGAAVEETLRLRAKELRSAGLARRVVFWAREGLGLGMSLVREWASPSELLPGWEADRRDSRNRIWMVEKLLRESRHALRRLWRAPAFTISAVLTLGLAMGANVAIFTLVRRIVLSPLPYERSDRLVMLSHGAQLEGASSLGISTGVYAQYLEGARSLNGIAMYAVGEQTVSGDGDPERLWVGRAMPVLAEVLGVRPHLGRWFRAAEGELDAPGVAVLTYGYWMRRYGGDAGVLGRTLILSGVPKEIIGIMPAGFAFPDARAQLWTALPYGPRIVRAGGFNYSGVARLRDGVSLGSAREEQNRLIARLPERFPGDEVALAIVNDGRLYSDVMPLKTFLVGPTAQTLWVLLGAVMVVLLVACANVANLFLVRAEIRQREVALRRALGAGQGSLAGFFLGESALLALLGGLLGLGLAASAVRVLVGFGPQNLPRLHEVRIDASIVGFAVALVLVSAVVFGLIPFLRKGAGLASALQETGRGNTPSATRMRARHLLMGGQVALALMLLVASVLMGRSFQHMLRVDPGFEEENALMFRAGLSSADFPNPPAVALFHRQLMDRIAAIPGVTRAAMTNCPPLAGPCSTDPVTVLDRPTTATAEVGPLTSFSWVSEGYFETLGVRLLAGRYLERSDFRDASVAVIDERLAQEYFGDEDPVGRRVERTFSQEPYTVVGVVQHVASRSLADPDPLPQLYMPHPLAPSDSGIMVLDATYVVRTESAPLELVPAIRRILTELSPNTAMARVATLEGALEQAKAPMAFVMTLLAIAAGVALVLGVIGIYGVITYAVAQRTSEIGVRMALGARPRDVAVMVVRQGGLVTLFGVFAGIGGALAATRLMGALLFGVSTTDPLSFATVSVFLLGIGLLACWLPARRAAQLDPLVALRNE